MIRPPHLVPDVHRAAGILNWWCVFAGIVAQRLCDAELKKELGTVWPNLSQKTMDLLVTPHKREHPTHPAGPN